MQAVPCVAEAIAAETFDASIAFCASNSSRRSLQLLELHVQPQHGDVERDDADEQHSEQADPEHAAGEPAFCGRRGHAARPRSRPDERRRLFGPGGRRPGCHYVFTAARKRADADRGFAATSSALGRITLRLSARNAGSRPHTHTGKSGGQVQPRS